MKHEGPKRAYWPTKHARDPAMKARMMWNVLPFVGQHGDSREVEAEVGGSPLVEGGRRDCCSSVSGSGLYESSPVSTSAWDSLIFEVGGERRAVALLGISKKYYAMVATPTLAATRSRLQPAQLVNTER